MAATWTKDDNIFALARGTHASTASTVAEKERTGRVGTIALTCDERTKVSPKVIFGFRIVLWMTNPLCPSTVTIDSDSV
jgi:hypothetical protein